MLLSFTVAALGLDFLQVCQSNNTGSVYATFSDTTFELGDDDKYDKFTYLKFQTQNMNLLRRQKKSGKKRRRSVMDGGIRPVLMLLLRSFSVLVLNALVRELQRLMSQKAFML